MKPDTRVLAASFVLAIHGLAAAQVPGDTQRAVAAPAAGAPPAALTPATSAGPRMIDLDKGPGRHLAFRPEDIAWQPGPRSFEPGAQYVVLEGDPGKDGVFTMQLKLPDGFVINPHSHPNVERVTVLSGTFRLGSGVQVDPGVTHALPAGSYTAMPPGMVHFAMAQGETIVQLTSVGPWQIKYVNPAHDPRK